MASVGAYLRLLGAAGTLVRHDALLPRRRKDLGAVDRRDRAAIGADRQPHLRGRCRDHAGQDDGVDALEIR